MRLPFLASPSLAAVLLLSASGSAFAEDVVYVLGRGGIEVYRGTITEGSPDGTIHFVTTEGKKRVFHQGEIANVVRDAKAETLALDSGDAGSQRRGGDGRLAVAFHGWVGWGTQALDHVNRSFEEDELLFASLGVPMTFERIGSAPDFGGGLAFPWSNGLVLGVECGYQGSSSRSQYEDPTFSLEADIELRVIDVVATAEYRLPMVRGLSVGGSAGVALGHADQQVNFHDFVDPLNDDSSHSSWGGSGFSGGAFAGWRKPLGDRTSLFLRTGWRSRDIGAFNGRTDSAQLTGPSKPVDNAGDDVQFDFSGAYARVGF
ncbi:MAG: hypothetical protein ACRDGR_03800, partial [bacterium]